MKLPFTIYDLRFTISNKSDRAAGSLTGASGAHGATRAAGLASNRKSSIVNRKWEQGIALVITLIMLAITLVMAVAFLALAHRERGSVTTTTDTTTARLAVDTAIANAQAQIAANLFNGVLNGGSSNAFNLRLLVSTNYINPAGFDSNPGFGSSNPTNVNYDHLLNSLVGLSADQRNQNIANLCFLPRAPVCVITNGVVGDFRFYLDLNQNGRFERNDSQVVISSDPANPYFYYNPSNPNDPQNGQTMPSILPGLTLSNSFTGDPEWVGVLEHPDAPHGPNNHFLSRYAFIALPVGNSLDLNYIHNQALNNGPNVSVTTPDYYLRNQGVGSWEINLAAFLADLNTNIWNNIIGPYYYGRPAGFPNTGFAFEDARALVAYRYFYATLPSANNVFLNAPNVLRFDGMDNYSRGPLQTNLDYNRQALLPAVSTSLPWSGADNTNHFFTVSDFLDPNKTSPNFVKHLWSTGTSNATYDRYTFYRMLDELGTDSAPDEGKMNLNYRNITNGAVVPGLETNLYPWTALEFFTNAADQMLRLYTAEWYGPNGANYRSFTNTFAVTAPFSITNIPVWVSNRFVYTPAVNRLLQLAANLYDASTNSFYPSVFRPLFSRNSQGDIFIIGYQPVTSVTGVNDTRYFGNPFDPSQLSSALNTPILDKNGFPVNVYGVPWIIGAKKGLPNFNQFSMVNSVQVQRYLQLARDSSTSTTIWTNHLYLLNGNNNLSVSFWNSYTNNYPTNYPGSLNLAVYVSSVVQMALTNSDWSVPHLFTYATNLIWTPSVWPGAKWLNAPGATPASNSFLTANWTNNFIPQEVYKTQAKIFRPLTDSDVWEVNNHSPDPLPQFGLATTNLLQAYIVDNTHVIDYVQLRGPIENNNLNSVLQDPNYRDATGQRYLFSTNASGSGTMPSWGIVNQIDISSTTGDNPPPSAQWNNPPNPTITGVDPIEAAKKFLNSMLDGTFYFTYAINGKGYTYYNKQLAVQAGYTASRTAYSSYLLQANDPLVHYLGSDLNMQPGAWAYWNQSLKRQNGIWQHEDDPTQIPVPPPSSVSSASYVGGRYQPWLQPNGQMQMVGGYIPLANNYAVIDPLVKHSDNWDFPTNPYPTVGWIGRVHRGTPWQTVYLKDADLTKNYTKNNDGTTNYIGTNTWANWTGDIKTSYGQFFDAANSAPVQDRLLFDIFTTRFNDNAVRGTLPVNQTHLAAWSALFSGMVALSNCSPTALFNTVFTNTSLIINPAGIVDSALPYKQQPPLWQIVNVTNFGISINATRANTSLFPFQSFTHVGDILATPALTVQSPFLNLGSSDPKTPWLHQMNYGISDELYEWLPQQMMGLVRLGEPRYVLYAWGQTLRPAPGGEVLSGPFFQLITNYQVVAESAVRAVIRVDNANSPKPHAVVETYNVLPPN